MALTRSPFQGEPKTGGPKVKAAPQPLQGAAGISQSLSDFGKPQVSTKDEPEKDDLALDFGGSELLKQHQRDVAFLLK